MRTDPSCIFCKIVAGEIPCHKLYENDLTLAFMDINPANSGHALAIAREHWEDLYAIPEELIGATAVTAKLVAEAVKRTVEPDGVNLVQANGAGAAQSVAHFHIHVLPRVAGDELKLNWGITPGDMAAIEALAARIRDNL